MKYIIFSLSLLLTNTILGQTDRDNYLITIGKYSFRPFFINYPGKPNSGQFTAGDDHDLKSFDIRFPKRSDTVLIHYPGDKPKKEIVVTDWYSIDLFVDSINRSYLDTLLKSVVSISYKKQPRQIYSLTFQIMYSDGKRTHETVSSNKLSDAATLPIKQFPYSYLIISQIKFFGDNKQRLSIDESIGWKIRDN